MIFKDVREGRPYPEHGLSMRDWARIPPRQIRMDELITTKRELRLDALLDEDSTFYGDLFPHAVHVGGRDLPGGRPAPGARSALQQRTVIHVRILDLDASWITTSARRRSDLGTGPASRPAPRRRALGDRPAHRRCQSTVDVPAQSPQRSAIPSASSRPR